jgi:chemotaxis protein methyltransferase CheR
VIFVFQETERLGYGRRSRCALCDSHERLLVRITMTDRECVEFLQWALPRLGYRWAGFRKVRRQVRRRIRRRVEQLGLDDVAGYRDRLEAHPDEWEVLDAFCSITISRFFRDRGVFEMLRTKILPQLASAAIAAKRSELHAWCAGAASGEEPYSLRILWDRFLAATFPQARLRILATDAREALLERARRASYPRSSLREVPAEVLESAFTREGSHHVVKAEHRAVEFRRQDIRRAMPEGTFDIVLCRNVAFTYFSEARQRDVARRIRTRLRPGGFLVVGSHERVPAGSGFSPLSGASHVVRPS